MSEIILVSDYEKLVVKILLLNRMGNKMCWAKSEFFRGSHGVRNFEIQEQQ
jgi:hypothetical protein